MTTPLAPVTGFQQFAKQWQPNAQMAWDAIQSRPTPGIATAWVNAMDWGLLEEVSGHPPGSYQTDPIPVYRDFQLAIGASFVDQWIPDNPLSMHDQGYTTGTERGATSGAAEIICDGMVIDSPEAVVAHMEQFHFPRLAALSQRLEANPDAEVARLIQSEVEVQTLFGGNMLKVPYDTGFQSFPLLHYYTYGYENYLMAYALYPELMERDFQLQADLGETWNRLAARAIIEGGLPKLVRLDFDLADSRSTLVDVQSLDRIWFPQFARSIKPLLDAGVRLIWHCDGNLMDMVPRLLEAGVGGFQGFQYEDGMDYERICRMKTRDGDDLFIWAGASVTRTLPHGTVADVKTELRWLVEHGPKAGFVLGASSSVAPHTNRENVKTLIAGLQYYREHGRK